MYRRSRTVYNHCNEKYFLLVKREDGADPALVHINIFLRSISKIDDYKMVSAQTVSHAEY